MHSVALYAFSAEMVAPRGGVNQLQTGEFAGQSGSFSVFSYRGAGQNCISVQCKS